MTANTTDPAPSPWIQRYGAYIRTGGTVLDLACGSGRHSRYFAELGHAVTAVDIDTARARKSAEDRGGAEARSGPIDFLQADLERDAWPLPGRTFDGVIVVNYLYRAHYPLLLDALAVGGVLLFDTFAAGNERFGRPSNPEYLLQPGELLRKFGAVLEIVAYAHGEVREPNPAVRQRLCAVRR